jgi:hypothetical protein
VCSDTAGTPAIMEPSDVDAISVYLRKSRGKCHIFGSYATFFHKESLDYDNRRLAPLFGLDQDASYGIARCSGGVKYVPAQDRLDSLLWKNIELPFISSYTEFPISQVPLDSKKWFDNEGNLLNKSYGQQPVKILARSEDGTSVILNYVSDTHSSLYGKWAICCFFWIKKLVSTMPEYRGRDNPPHIMGYVESNMQVFFIIINFY